MYRKIPLILLTYISLPPNIGPQICNPIKVLNINSPRPTHPARIYAPPEYKSTWINFGNINVNVICT